MKHKLTSLPYGEGDLEPQMSRKTLEYHHGKHHAGYVNNLNNLIEGTEYEDASLETIIHQADGTLYNNAAQAWNHTFFFDQFASNPKAKPEGALLEAIEMSFGSFGSFKEQFSEAAIKLFGSGWVWLVRDGKHELAITPMINAANPLREPNIPILTCDVWEHAYYIDYFNNRADYLKNFWELINWNVIEKRFER